MLLAAALAAGLWGCDKPEMSMEGMKPPPRPAELGQLEWMVGKWQGGGECEMAGTDQPMKWTGVNEIGWEANGWVLMERMEGEFGGEKMSGIGLWSWNPDKKNFDVFWADSFGGMSHGTAYYDSADQTWHSKARSKGPMGESIGTGTTRQVGSDRMDWTYTEWDKWKTTKYFDMKGWAERVK
jgi:hypothetical protein